MHRVSIYLFLLFFSVELYAQRPEILFERISVSQGLLDHSINCVTQDHIGFMWMGGTDGLYKYDGNEFISYQYQPGNNVNQYFREVYRIKEDRFGFLWILSDAGIVIFDPIKVRSVLLHPYSYEKKSEDLTYAPDLLIDAGNNVWVTYKNGLLKISCSDIEAMQSLFSNEKRSSLISEFIELPLSKSDSHNFVTKLFEDKNQNILIGCFDGLFQYNKKQQKLIRFTTKTGKEEDSSFQLIRSIIEDTDNSYWIAANNSLLHLNEINPVSGSVQEFVLPSEISKYVVGEGLYPTSLLIDQKHNIYLGTNMGSYKVDKTKKTNITFTPLESDENEPEYYGYTKIIRDIFQDKSGVIWTAQEYYGITKFNPDKSQFNSYKKLIIRIFRSTDLNPLYKDKNGNLWIGTYGGGLYKIAPDNKQVNCYNMYMQKNNILSISEISPDLFWIGTNRGCVVFNTKTGKSNAPSDDGLNVINKKEPLIWDIQKTNNQIFLASSDGLYQFDLKSSQVSLISFEKSDIQPQARNPVLSLLKLKSGEILVPTSLQGIFITNHSKINGFTQVFDNKILLDNGISLDRRHRLFEDRDGIIWLVDYSGLHRLNMQTHQIVNYKLFDKISYPVAWSIEEDDNDNLWIGTHYGLCCFNKSTGKIKTYGKESGLPVIIHGLNSVFKDRNGRLYFGGIGGFYDFNPDSIVTKKIIPPVVITDILLFNESIKSESSRFADSGRNLPTLKSIKFKYNQNDLAFKFAALDYNNSGENRYQYRLEGYQDQWVNTDGSNCVASYLKLKPGTYEFRVKGANYDGVWNEEGASLQVIIQKPWWSTYLAWAIYLILVFAGIRGIFIWRLYRHKKEREDLENQVSVRTREIQEQTQMILKQKELLEIQNEKIREDEELKSRFFSNISHEFRTPLALIKSPTEELLDDSHLNEKVRRKLSMINRNAQRLLNLVNQLLDLSKFDSKKMTLEVCEGDVMKHLNSICISFSSLAEAKNIRFICRFDESQIITWFDHDKIEKIASNLLSNAFKFTPSGAEIEISAKYVKKEGINTPLILEFAVADKGPGIPERSLDKVFDRFYQIEETLNTENVGTGIGLSLSRDLTRLMHGDITIQSKLQLGSTFTVSIPLGIAHLKPDEYTIVSHQPENNEIIKLLNTNYIETDDDECVQNEGKGNPIILIVDDNRDLRNQLFDNLKANYTIIIAADGIAGLKKAQEIIPDLMITDLMMPKMNGIELCQKIRENEITCHIPIIMLTAKDTLDDKISGLQTGADDYIAKPFSMAELKARIANLIDQRKKLRELFSKKIKLEPGDVTITSADEKFIHKAISIVEKHLNDELFDLVVFRQEMNLSRSTLARKLDALTGHSPTEFIRIIRLKRAASLLKQNFGNVTEVALEVGFNDLSYFNKSFKKFFGLSPIEYSKQEKSLE